MHEQNPNEDDSEDNQQSSNTSDLVQTKCVGIKEENSAMNASDQKYNNKEKRDTEALIEKINYQTASGGFHSG